MKKIFSSIMALFLAFLIAPPEGKGQGVPSSHPEFIMPTYTGSTLLDIHIPIYTSAYSYPQVYFDMTGSGSYAFQDLYVYSSNNGNFTSSIIGWIRRNPMSMTVVDAGFIYVPVTKTTLEVGIVQAPDAKVYVIASFMGGNGAEYDLYEWTPSGLSATPVYNENISWVSAVPSSGQRMTMDCYGLRQVTFAWDEEPRYIGTSAENIGGIFTRAMELTSSAFPLFTSGASVQVDGTDSTCRMPDIAMGMNGSIMRVAYFDEEAPLDAHIHVKSESFTNILGFITPGDSWPYMTDWTLLNETDVTTNPYADHIHIDCPDQVTAAGDVWAVVYKPDMASVSILKQPAVGLPFPTPVSGILAGNNCSPVVAYAPDANYINIGWYNTDIDRYVARRMDVSGTGYIIPTGFTYYIIPNTTTDLGCGYGSRMAFCTQQSFLDMGAFIAYPIVYSTLTGLGDMRSKVVSWSPFTGPFSAQGMLPEEEITVLPNPFRSEIEVRIPDYRGTNIDAVLYDITGKLLLEIKASDLDETNRRLGEIAGRLSPGNYLLHVNHSGVQTHFKITKL